MSHTTKYGCMNSQGEGAILFNPEVNNSLVEVEKTRKADQVQKSVYFVSQTLSLFTYVLWRTERAGKIFVNHGCGTVNRFIAVCATIPK